MDVVVFNKDEFILIYPNFANNSAEQLQTWFDMACQIINNTASSPIPYNIAENKTVRKTILYATTCHIGTILGGDSVGRVSSASEGSVSVSLDYADNSKSSAWWNQSKCGAFAWQMLKPYRFGGLYFEGA